jgi:2-iminobutanoate/2-iminopropanoate deaminase
MMSGKQPQLLFDPSQITTGARDELKHLGLLSAEGTIQETQYTQYKKSTEPCGIEKRAINAPDVLNDARCYGSSFPRGLRIQFGGLTALLISGTASIDDSGKTVHVGDFAAQCLRTYRNIAALLASEGASWHDVVRTTCYLRDIERDYDEFNRIRTSFFSWMGLDPLPASVGIQARLCRSDLLIEIEAIALLPQTSQPAAAGAQQAC